MISLALDTTGLWWPRGFLCLERWVSYVLNQDTVTPTEGRTPDSRSHCGRESAASGHLPGRTRREDRAGAPWPSV